MTPAGAPLHGFLRLLVAALPLLVLALHARADSSKPAASLPSSAVPAAVARVPTAPPKVSTVMKIPKEPVGYIGGMIIFVPGIVMDGGKTNPNVFWNTGEHCRIEFRVVGWKTMFDERTCEHEFLFDVPESLPEGPRNVQARYVATGRLLESPWVQTSLHIYKSRTKLELLSTSVVGQPMKIGGVGPTWDTFDVRIRMTRPYASEHSTIDRPVANRTVIINPQGMCAAGSVPKSDVNGLTTFTIKRGEGPACEVQVAFMGDSAYQPSMLLVKMPK
jgi:hypothetical protein